MKWTHGAVVTVADSAGRHGNLIRPAAFVFEVQGGWAWLEPSYADPYGASSPSLHTRKGAPTVNGAGDFMEWAGGEERITVCAYRPGAGKASSPLDWWLGVTPDVAAERDRMRQEVLASIRTRP